MKKTKKPPVARILRLYVAGKLSLRGVQVATGLPLREVRQLLELYDIEEKSPGRRGRKGAGNDDD